MAALQRLHFHRQASAHAGSNPRAQPHTWVRLVQEGALRDLGCRRHPGRQRQRVWAGTAVPFRPVHLVQLLHQHVDLPLQIGHLRGLRAALSLPGCPAASSRTGGALHLSPQAVVV